MLINLSNNSDISINEAFDNFINYCIIKKLRPYSLEYYRDSWHTFKKVLGDISLNDIDKKLIDKYILCLKNDYAKKWFNSK